MTSKRLLCHPMSETPEELRAYLSKIGKKGGSANTSEGQGAKGRKRWEGMTPAQRSAQASLNRRKGIARQQLIKETGQEPDQAQIDKRAKDLEK